MTAWQPIETAPKDREILVRGGGLQDEAGSPGFGGEYLVYWVGRDNPRVGRLLKEADEPGVWLIRAGFGEVAFVVYPTEWCEIPT